MATQTKHRTDVLMVDIHRALIQDATVLFGPWWTRYKRARLLKSKRTMNDSFVDYWETDRTRMGWQITTFLKRFTASNDFSSEAQREEVTLKKFRDLQARYVGGEIPYRSYLVVQRARAIARELLGDFDAEELEISCRFGRKASVGVPFASSYLSNKMDMLTGTEVECAWFTEHVKHDPHLGAALLSLTRGVPSPGAIPAVVCVPKSWKALRTIAPDTVIGGYRHNGLGLMLERRLKKAGLNIHDLQDRHKAYVLHMSKHDYGVTADLSAASDSFTSALVNRLLPRAWYRALKLGLSTTAKLDGRLIKLTTFMTMGIGFTFTLQTLLFYCLLKSLEELTGIIGRISVYGDDLIYPQRLHPFVRVVFSDLGFKLNADKTFTSGPFRESCGTDAYRGCNIRPFMPEISSKDVATVEDELCLLYQLFNGFQERWSYEDLPRVFAVIEKRLRVLVGDSYLHPCVPTFFDSKSGIKVARVIPTLSTIRLQDPVYFPGHCTRFSNLTPDTLRVKKPQGWAVSNVLLPEVKEHVLNLQASACYLWDYYRIKGQQQQIEISDVPVAWIASGSAWKAITPSMPSSYTHIQAENVVRWVATPASRKRRSAAAQSARKKRIPLHKIKLPDLVFTVVVAKKGVNNYKRQDIHIPYWML